MNDNINVNVSGPVQPSSVYKTVVLKGNHSFVSQVTEPNTKYVIKHNFNLGGDVTIPENCVLEFDGGSISGAYTITGNNTGIIAGLVKIFNTDITISGIWNVTEAYPEWFGATSLGEDCSIPIQRTVDSFNNIKFSPGTYVSNNEIICKRNNYIYGEGTSTIIQTRGIQVVEVCTISNIKISGTSNTIALLSICSEYLHAAYARIRLNNIFLQGTKQDENDYKGILIKSTHEGTSGFHSIYINNVMTDGRLSEGIEIDTSEDTDELLWITDIILRDCFFYATRKTVSIKANLLHPNNITDTIDINNVHSQYNSSYGEYFLYANKTQNLFIHNSFMWDLPESIKQYHIGKNSENIEITSRYINSINIVDYIDSETDGNVESIINKLTLSSTKNTVKVYKIDAVSGGKAILGANTVSFGSVSGTDIFGNTVNGRIIEFTLDSTVGVTENKVGLFVDTLGTFYNYKIEQNSYKLYPLGSFYPLRKRSDALYSAWLTEYMGSMVYCTDIRKPIWNNGNGNWISADGCKYDVPRSGAFANKPAANNIYVGFKYFCTDKPSAPGSPIYYTGDNTTPWVYADGTTVL